MDASQRSGSSTMYPGDNDNLVAAGALDLIRGIDTAFSNQNASILSSEREVEDARRNANMAAELARRFSCNGDLENLDSLLHPPLEEETNGHHHVTSSPQRPPPPPAATNGFHHHDDGEPPRKNGYHSKINADRLQQQTNELLELSLELERVKARLEQEQFSHDETRSRLQSATERNAEVQSQMDDLLMHMETARETSGREVEEVEMELQSANEKLQEAEADAEAALEIAKTSAAESQELSQYLETAMEEADRLRAYIHDMPAKKHVRFQDDDDDKQSTRPTRSLVAAGRQVFQRRLAESDDDTPVKVSLDVEERRMRLQSKIQELLDLPDNDNSGIGIGLDSDGTKNKQMGTAVQSLGVCRKTAQILKDSGKALKLSAKFEDEISPHDEVHLPELATTYTVLVTNLLERRQREVTELESLLAVYEA